MLQARVAYFDSQEIKRSMYMKNKIDRYTKMHHFGIGKIVVFECMVSIGMIAGLFVSTYGIVGSIYLIKWMIDMII